MSPSSDHPAEGPVRVVVDPDLAPIVPEMVANLLEDLEGCARALDAGDFARPEIVGHQMKGTGSGFGFHFVSELGAELETAASAGDEGACRALVLRLRALLGRVEVVEGKDPD